MQQQRYDPYAAPEVRRNEVTVQSEPLKNGKVEKKKAPSAALVSQGGVIGAMIFILRVIAIILMVASTFGNYVQFMGGWARYWPVDGLIVAAAVVYQLICSLLQWGFKAGGMWIPYTLSLLASAASSFLTYNAWAGPYLAVQVGPYLGIVVLLIATIGADALPEWVLVE
jgi:hypothetical protein